MNITKTPTGATIEVTSEELVNLQRATESASNTAKSMAIDMKDFPDVSTDLREDSEAYAGLSDQITAIRNTW